ncbi:MAG: methyltransferase [Bryobacteraceae bacterium]
MSTDTSLLAPLRVEDAALAVEVRRGLLAFGYNGDAVRMAISESRAPGAAPADHGALAMRMPPVSPLACLIRAFVLNAATPEEAMRAQLGAEFFDLCETAGLWSHVEQGVVGSVVVMVDGKTFLLSDHAGTRLGDLAMHWVMGIGTSTMKLAHSVARRPYERVLDLCCGGGIQAFMLSPHAKQIVAVDRNARALNYGRFGAGMNKFNNITFRESDCYSAVEGEKFDAIVCNPPYVLTPDRQTYYRDGGMGGDRFAEKILREAPAYLREGGLAHVMCDVAAMDGQSSEARLRGWLAGNGCDVLAIGSRAVDAATYARNWLRKDGEPLEERRWIDSFRELGVAGVTNTLVVLRKRTAGGPNWFLPESIAAEPKGYFGHQVARAFACQDLLQLEDDAIGTTKLRLAAEVRVVNTLRPESGKWLPESSRITFAEGLAREYPVDPQTAAVLALFDGRRKTVDVLPGGQFRMGHVRQLVGYGVLEPV